MLFPLWDLEVLALQWSKLNVGVGSVFKHTGVHCSLLILRLVASARVNNFRTSRIPSSCLPVVSSQPHDKGAARDKNSKPQPSPRVGLPTQPSVRVLFQWKGVSLPDPLCSVSCGVRTDIRFYSGSKCQEATPTNTKLDTLRGLGRERAHERAKANISTH